MRVKILKETIKQIENMKMYTKTEKKYLAFLNDVYLQCINGGDFSLTDLTEEHKVSKRLGSLLIREGRIANEGLHKHPIYVWKTIKPNIYMVNHIQELVRRENKVIQEKMQNRELSVKDLKDIVDSKDIKNIPIKTIAKKYAYSYTHLVNIYHAAKGSKSHREILNNNLKATVDEFLTSEKTPKIKATPKVETIKVAPRMHPVVESTQKSIVILWGLINIKF